MMVVSTTGRVHIRGPLGAHVEGFEAELVRLGFAPTSVVNQLRMAAHLNRWLDAQSLGVEDLTVERVEAFIRERRASYTALFSRRALRPLLGWLAASGVIAAEVALPRRDLLARWAPYPVGVRARSRVQRPRRTQQRILGNSVPSRSVFLLSDRFQHPT